MKLGHSSGMRCTISEDKMMAELILLDAWDVSKINLKSITEVLTLFGVKYGIDEELVESIATKPEDFFRQCIPIANGLPAVQHIPAEVIFAFKHPIMEEEPLIREDGSADYKELRRLNNVLRGQFLAEWIPPVPGTNGMSVTGEVIKVDRMPDQRVYAGVNTVWNEDRTKLFATGDGLATWTADNKVNVFPEYNVDSDVSYRTGNVDFTGCVSIVGNIMPGFKVKAAGDVIIKGNCEGGIIEAGGCIVMIGGVIGGKESLVKAGTDLHCVYLLDADVSAGRDVIVTQTIIRSRVDAGKVVRCDGKKSLVVGGVITAGVEIQCQTVGNPMESTTTLRVGLYERLRNEAGQIRDEMHVWRTKVEQTTNAIQLLERLSDYQRLNEQQTEMLDQLQARRKEFTKIVNDSMERWSELQLLFDQALEGQIIVNKRAFAGLTAWIGKNQSTLKDQVEGCVFRFLANAVRCIPLTSTSESKR